MDNIIGLMQTNDINNIELALLLAEGTQPHFYKWWIDRISLGFSFNGKWKQEVFEGINFQRQIYNYLNHYKLGRRVDLKTCTCQAKHPYCRNWQEPKCDLLPF